MTRGAVVWITGLPSSGKSTLAQSAHARLVQLGTSSCVLDGDEVRRALVPAPAFDAAARDRFYETLGNLAVLLANQGLVVLVAATSHQRSYRDRARAAAQRFFEVWVDVPLDECRKRDTKGLYGDFERGRAHDVPGEDAAYEPPANPELRARGGADRDALEALVALVS